MKLGLLVVLAVAVLVPSLSESRTVSKCELREQLGKALTLPRGLQKHKDRILTIGEVKGFGILRFRSAHDPQNHKEIQNCHKEMQNDHLFKTFSLDVPNNYNCSGSKKI